MLPFLKKKVNNNPGVIIQGRPAAEPVEKTEDLDTDAMLDCCAQDLLDAVQARDVAGIKRALQDAFTIMETVPHEEAEHVEPHSYDAQNIKAGKERI